MSIPEKLMDFIENLRDIGIKKKKKPSRIPEAWLTPKQKYATPMDWVLNIQPTPVEISPIARNPVFSFDITKKDSPFFRSNLVIRVKRTIIFMLLLACIISILSFSIVNPASLLFYLPTTLIFLDFLRRTQTEKRKGWLVLKDIEGIPSTPSRIGLIKKRFSPKKREDTMPLKE